jgi:hypothetical protein
VKILLLDGTTKKGISKCGIFGQVDFGKSWSQIEIEKMFSIAKVLMSLYQHCL